MSVWESLAWSERIFRTRWEWDRIKGFLKFSKSAYQVGFVTRVTTPLSSSKEPLKCLWSKKKNNVSLYKRPFKMEKSNVFLLCVIFYRSRDIHDFVLCKLENWGPLVLKSCTACMAGRGNGGNSQIKVTGNKMQSEEKKIARKKGGGLGRGVPLRPLTSPFFSFTRPFSPPPPSPL